MKVLALGSRAWLAYAAAAVLVAAVSITVALLITPMQQVSVAGQTVTVGAAAPTLSTSGPGELDLFGQSLPTRISFLGPVRPRLALTHITLGQQLGSLFSSQRQTAPGHVIGQALAAGWTRYFGWEIVITAGFALLLAGALAGWARLHKRRTLAVLGAFLVFTELVNVGGIMITAYTAPERLRHVGSVEALVGQAQVPPVPSAPGPARPAVQAVVMGDSTAAGLGNPQAAHPSLLARYCQRSPQAYADVLSQLYNWHVLNLACSGATIPAGILGPQQLSGFTAPAQLSVAKKATNASVLITSIGADDVGWSALLRLCTITPTCDNRAAIAYFQQRLAVFAVHYYQLLRQLAALPSHPTVLINLYYDPLDPQQHCLDSVGLTPAKEKSLLILLNALNEVLAKGARASGLIAVHPDFTGHALCDPNSFVQGLSDPAPFHPNAAGELTIALADQAAINQHPAPSPSPSLTPSPTPSPLAAHQACPGARALRPDLAQLAGIAE
jgi:GDSL-like Lipase/Acylhydrolase family